MLAKSRPIVLVFILILMSTLYLSKFTTHHELISLFPIQNYDQKITSWIKPSDIDYDKPLLTSAQQKIRQAEWYDHYYGNRSPWSPHYVRQIFSTTSPQNLKSGIQEKINFYSNKDKLENQIGYGANFRPYSDEWIAAVERNINLKQFDVSHYDLSKRAIAIDNIKGRQLPTHEVHFYNHQSAGEGYPFDNLQAAVIWAGTPLYILGETEDRAWSLILAPSFIAWVKSMEIARVDEGFIKTWQTQAKSKMIAITKTNVPIKDSENNLYRFSGYIGMVLPGKIEKNEFHMMIPVSDDKRQARIHHAVIPKQYGVVLPLLPSPRHFVSILSELIGRPYGWGGMYFYNDCASELKNLYTPFGIWLPIHSSDQVNQEQYLINKVDLSNANLETRLDYLMHHGHKFMTIVYIGGHVFMYVGNYADPKDPSQKMFVLSYQNMWGLRPNNANPSKDRRAVIGKAVLFPILKKYPEDKTLTSPADKKYFQIGYLDEFPENSTSDSFKTDIHTLLNP